MIYEIVTAAKSDAPTEEELRAALAKAKPGLTVANIESDESTWTIRLEGSDKVADKPDFLKKKDEGDSVDESDSSDSVDDADSDSESDSDSSDDSDGDSDSDKDGDGDKKGGDPVAEVKKVIDQLTTLFTDLGGKVQDLQTAHDEKAQKLKDIGDTVGGEGGPGGLDGAPEGVSPVPPAAGKGLDVGPTPGKPPMPGPGFDKRKPGVPAGVPAFTNYQVATHPGVDDKGERISLTAAAVAMETDPDFKEYEVVGMTENADGTFSAKLKLRD